MLWQDYFKNDISESEIIYFTHVSLKQKKSIFFTPFGLQVVPILLKKHIKPIIMLKVLVENKGSLSSKNLKYHVSIPM